MSKLSAFFLFIKTCYIKKLDKINGNFVVATFKMTNKFCIEIF